MYFKLLFKQIHFLVIKPRSVPFDSKVATNLNIMSVV